VRLADLLQSIPGLEKRFVHYLEAQGDIRPTLLPKSRIARRDYSSADLRRLRRLWDFYRRGYALNTARQLLAAEADQRVYALLRVDQRRAEEAADQLRQSDRLLELARVYGADAELVASFEAARDEDAYAALQPALERGLLGGITAVRRARVVFSRPTVARGGALTMLAYVLLTLPAKQLDPVLERLRGFDGIVEAAVVYGETDVIAKLDVPSQAALDVLVVRKIQSIPQVQSTRTYIVVGDLHWRRPPEDGPDMRQTP
jgi:DNA-binding Lrp family transcriptional regulator